MCKQRQKELDNTTQRMKLFERWDLQRGVEEKKARIEAERVARERAEKARVDAEAAKKEAETSAAEAARLADERLTQDALVTMRKTGTIAGVNAPEADDFPSQLETAKVVTLYNRPEDEIDKTKAFGKTKGGKASARNFTWFTVDLKVRRVRGEGRGVRGEA